MVALVIIMLRKVAVLKRFTMILLEVDADEVVRG